MKTKPFNLEEALANPDRVICRDGVKPDDLHYFKQIRQWRFTRRENPTGLYSSDTSGRSYPTYTTDLDLLLTCETKLVPFTYETFLPHRDRWINSKSGPKFKLRVVSVDPQCVTLSRFPIPWGELFEAYEFEDGTPCGVEVEE